MGIFIDVGAGATPRSTVELQPEEIVILTRVLDSRDKSLLVWQADIGLMLLIDGQPIADPRDAEVAQLYIEGFQRLERYGLLVMPPVTVACTTCPSRGVCWRSDCGASALGAVSRWTIRKQTSSSHRSGSATNDDASTPLGTATKGARCAASRPPNSRTSG